MFPKRIKLERLHLEWISHSSINVSDLHELYRNKDEAEEMFKYWDSSPHATVKETYDYVDKTERLWDVENGGEICNSTEERRRRSNNITVTTGISPN